MLRNEMTAALSSMTVSDQAYCEVSIITGKQIKKVHKYLGAPKKLRQLEIKSQSWPTQNAGLNKYLF